MQELRRILYSKLFDNSAMEPQGDMYGTFIGLNAISRTGSAPPQLDDLPGSPFFQDGQGLSLLGTAQPANSTSSECIEAGEYIAAGHTDR